MIKRPICKTISKYTNEENTIFEHLNARNLDRSSVYFKMDILESLLSRFPPNWWYALYPKDCDVCDYILPYLPISHGFMMRAFDVGGLLHRGGLSAAKFNTYFQGKFEITTYKKRGGNKICYVRNCGENHIQHTPKDQIYGVVDVLGTGIRVIRRKLTRF